MTGKNNDWPDPGPKRYWEGKHQPQKKTAPLRIELRERTNTSDRFIQSWTRLIAFEDTIADEAVVVEAMNKILDRASKVDQFVGHLTDPVKGGS